MHSPTAIAATPSWDVFIAYASPDRLSAKRIADSLGPFLRVFLDVDQLQIGDSWDEELREALEAASIVVVLLSKHTAAAFFGRDELLRAIDRMRREPEKCAVVPVYLDGFSPTSPSLPYGLRPLQGFALAHESDLESLGRAVITCLSDLRPDAIEVPTLSKGIIAHYEKIDLEVRQLTSEQYRAIQQLKHLKRVRISGSAGSGKTLVALEKCARLAAAGKRVMFLCHNPLLAEFATTLVPNAGVYVTDFCGWIEATLAEKPSGEWSHYFEPTGDQLARFVEDLEASTDKFDAVIVDEAQDFRDEWWHAVEKALRPDAEATLYVFHDNNQSLLPRRGNYPIPEPRIDLSRNCRNAGRVYELMRYFDTYAPETEKSLSGLGQVSFISFSAGEELTALEAMVRQHCSLDRLQNTVLLWSGVEPAKSCPLAHAEIKIRVSSPWQAEVLWQFQTASRFLPRTGITMPRGGVAWVEEQLAGLSTALQPTTKDKELICDIANAYKIERAVSDYITSHSSSKNSFRWSVNDGRLTLRRASKKATWGSEIIYHFQQANWHDGIPDPHRLRVLPFTELQSQNSLKLYSVSDFKGLEAETVLLVMRGRITSHKSSLYVAISRARSVLSIAADPIAASDLPRTFRWDRFPSATSQENPSK